MAHVGIEFAVAHDEVGEAIGVGVKRAGKFADLVVGEMRCQRFGLAGLTQRADALRKLGHRTHHPTRQPVADQKREHAEAQYRADQRREQLPLAEFLRTDVEANERPIIGILVHRKLVRPYFAFLARRLDVVYTSPVVLLPLKRHVGKIARAFDF